MTDGTRPCVRLSKMGSFFVGGTGCGHRPCGRRGSGRHGSKRLGPPAVNGRANGGGPGERPDLPGGLGRPRQLGWGLDRGQWQARGRPKTYVCIRMVDALTLSRVWSPVSLDTCPRAHLHPPPRLGG